MAGHRAHKPIIALLAGKDEELAAERIGTYDLLGFGGQAIKPVAQIDRIAGEIDFCAKFRALLVSAADGTGGASSGSRSGAAGPTADLARRAPIIKQAPLYIVPPGHQPDLAAFSINLRHQCCPLVRRPKPPPIRGQTMSVFFNIAALWSPETASRDQQMR